MIKEACPAAGLDPWATEFVWRGASGFAHGKQWPRLAFGDVTSDDAFRQDLWPRLSVTIRHSTGAKEGDHT
jgi:hypothetical protein